MKKNLKIARDRKALGLLIDPDKTFNKSKIKELAIKAEELGVYAILVGGSLVTNDHTDKVVQGLKIYYSGPVVLFPGGLNQLTSAADAILFLSLISGRNPEFLISKQVAAAPLVREMGLQVIPTGYMLIGEGSSASYMSNTVPIPYEKNDIAMATALAGEMLGHQVIYLDAGSGARLPVEKEMISSVRSSVSLPLIVGGGIRSFDDAYSSLEAGADMLVIGNAVEQDPSILMEVSGAVKVMNSLNVHK